MVDDDIELILNQYKMNLIAFEIPQRVYMIKAIIAYNDEKSKGGFQIDYDDVNMKTNLLERSNIMVVNFDGESYLNTLLAFTPF